MHLLLTHRPGLRIELTDENPFSKYGAVLRVFHGPYVDEYYRPDEVIAYGMTAARDLSCYAGKRSPNSARTHP